MATAAGFVVVTAGAVVVWPGSVVAAVVVSPGRVVTAAVVVSLGTVVTAAVVASVVVAAAAVVVTFVLLLQAENAKTKVNTSNNAKIFFIDISPFKCIRLTKRLYTEMIFCIIHITLIKRFCQGNTNNILLRFVKNNPPPKSMSGGLLKSKD